MAIQPKKQGINLFYGTAFHIGLTSKCLGRVNGRNTASITGYGSVGIIGKSALLARMPAQARWDGQA